MRGYFGIGIERSKFEVNVGSLWRSAYSFDADFIFTLGRRYEHQHTDTTKAWRHIPYFEFKTVDDLLNHVPYSCPVVGVEIDERATPLEDFVHPTRAIYLLGPEDGSLSRKAIEACHYLVQFDSKHCVNVAVAGSIVMYDRQQKRR